MKSTKNNSKNVRNPVVQSAKHIGASSKGINKQKVLLPTLKEQQRYVVYKILPKNPEMVVKDYVSLHNNLMLQCNNMLGIFDGGKAGLMSAKYNPDKLSGIIRVNNKFVDKLKVCLGLIKSINNLEITVDCIFVSGMLNKAAEKMDA